MEMPPSRVYFSALDSSCSTTKLYPRINDYDKWAIEYGYKPTDFKTPKEDHLYWNKVIIDRREAAGAHVVAQAQGVAHLV